MLTIDSVQGLHAVQVSNTESHWPEVLALKTALPPELLWEGPRRPPSRDWAVRSRLQPMIEVARMLQRRFENIITYLRHRITNAGSESINAKVQWVKYTARGFRNKRNFIHAIYFHCGGLDLAPEATK